MSLCVQILVREREEQAVDAGLYASFVRGCMSPFIRCTRNLNLLHTVAAGLFAKYKTLTDEGARGRPAPAACASRCMGGGTSSGRVGLRMLCVLR